MDKRKLIGTIIGVTMFGLLIVGATFAWLTFSATVTNGTYTAGARNFVIDYGAGSDITNVQILTLTTGAEVASNVANNVTVTAKLSNANSPYGTLKLTLKTTTDAGGIITSNASTTALRYAVAMCTDTSTSTACTPGTPSAPQTVTSTSEVLKLDGTNTTTTLSSNTLTTRIKVYVWVDAEKTTNAMLNKQFTAYIEATATQQE